MSDTELARVRAEIADLPPRMRGAAAVEAGRGIAAAVVLDGRQQSPSAAAGASNDWSTVPARWILLASAPLLAVFVAGLSHLGGRGGRLEPETGADVALVSTLLAVVLSVIAVRLLPRMPLPVRAATRLTLLLGWVVLPVGIVLGLLRLALGETNEIDVMVRAAVVQAAGAVVLLVLWRRLPRAVGGAARSALTDEDCGRLRQEHPDTAQRMKDAEIQALLALTALGQVDERLAARESARIDERWGGTGESSPST